jgi:hypothetical protein
VAEPDPRRAPPRRAAGAGQRPLSERSARRWRRWAPGLARELLSAFSPVLAQTPADAARLGALGARLALCLGNLKDAAAPLPADPASWRGCGRRRRGAPCSSPASTHPGEEAIVLDAHRRAAGPPARPPHGDRAAPPPSRAGGGGGSGGARARPAAPRAKRPVPARRSTSRTRWASSACSTASPGRASSAGRWCRTAGRTRWNPPASTAPSCSAPTPPTSPSRWRACSPRAGRSGWKVRTRRRALAALAGACYRIRAARAGWWTPPPAPRRVAEGLPGQVADRAAAVVAAAHRSRPGGRHRGGGGGA